MNASSHHRITTSSNGKPRLLCLLQLPPPMHGAAITNQYAINSDILHDAFELDVLPMRFTGELGDLGQFSFAKIGRLLLTAIELIKKLLFSRPDAVYFTIAPTGNAFYRDLVLVGIIKLFCVRRILHIRGVGIIDACQKNPRLKSLYSWAFADAQVIVLSHLVYPDLADFVPETHLHVVANGRPEPALQPPERDPAASPVSILFVSTMMEAKGALVLLEALRHLVSEEVDFQAVFVGQWLNDTFKRKWEKRIDELGLARHVEYRGALYEQELEDAYRAADILAFPTLHECFPGVILEAMSHGLPVVASREGSIPEILANGEAGLLVPKNDAGKLAEALYELISNADKRMQFSDAAYSRFMEEYTLPAFEHRLRNALQAAINF